METISRALARCWQPLFIVLALTWLWAPAVNLVGLEHLQYISNYEGTGQPLGAWFRAADIAAALLLLLMIWWRGTRGLDKRMRWLLTAYAFLTVIDGLFPVTCAKHILGCQEVGSFSRTVHDIESALSAVVLLVAATYDAVRHKVAASWLFVGLQAVFITMVVGKLATGSALAAVQYAYQSAAILWLVWRVSSYQDHTYWRPYYPVVRRVAATWAALSGLASIVLTAGYLRAFGPGRSLILGVTPNHLEWLHPYSILLGVLMLYLARQLVRGQRRAALVLLTLFALQILRFAILEPRPLLLAVYLGSFAGLFLFRHAFDRNTGPLTQRRRIYDALSVLGLAAVAVGVVITIAALTGHSARLRHMTLGTVERRTARLEDSRRFEAVENRRAFHRSLVVLVGGVIVMAAWSLFRPARLKSTTEPSTETIEDLLQSYSVSSEDYAKRWPADKQYFMSPAIDGFVAYRVVGGTAFALADPVAEPAVRGELLQAFMEYCRRHGWSSCFLLVDEAHKQLYANEFKSLTIGSSAVIPIERFVTETLRDKWWRWQTNRSTKAGYQYECLSPPHSIETLETVRAVSDAWLTRPGHKEQGFALGNFEAGYLQASRLHILRDAEGRAVAFANEPPAYNHATQVTVDLIRFLPEADNAMPALLSSALRTWHEEGRFKTFDLGFVPLAGADSAPVKVLRRVTRGRFSSAGLQQFKNKFRPDWHTNYLMYEGDVLDLATIATRLETALRKQPLQEQEKTAR